jgi:protein-S-isoprenylcysteine O-methyltransferase Ste14
MIELILAYTILISFFLLESFIREGNAAKTIAQSSSDKKSTYLIGLTLIVILFLSIVLNLLGIGKFENKFVAILGLAMMLAGLIIRIYSMLTLRKYYTRTLRVTEEHDLVTHGPYRFIRHPGYLGTILIWGACGLAMQNTILTIVSLILIFIAYSYRVVNEERMLTEKFGAKYVEYKKDTWRLVPFIW